MLGKEMILTLNPREIRIAKHNTYCSTSLLVYIIFIQIIVKQTGITTSNKAKLKNQTLE